MDVMGNHLFARSGLAHNEHGGRMAGHLLCQFHDSLERFASDDKVLHPIAGMAGGRSILSVGCWHARVAVVCGLLIAVNLANNVAISCLKQ